MNGRNPACRGQGRGRGDAISSRRYGEVLQRLLSGPKVSLINQYTASDGELLAHDSFDLHSHWIIENHGVGPDITVHNTPAELLAGSDAQLHSAVHYRLKALAKHPPVQAAPPPALPAYASPNAH